MNTMSPRYIDRGNVCEARRSVFFDGFHKQPTAVAASDVCVQSGRVSTRTQEAYPGQSILVGPSALLLCRDILNFPQSLFLSVHLSAAASWPQADYGSIRWGSSKTAHCRRPPETFGLSSQCGQFSGGKSHLPGYLGTTAAHPLWLWPRHFCR